MNITLMYIGANYLYMCASAVVYTGFSGWGGVVPLVPPSLRH